MIPPEETDALALYIASLGGVAQLAGELEQQGISTPDESLEEALRLMPHIEQGVEDARREL